MSETSDAVDVDTRKGRVRGRWRESTAFGRSAAFLGIPFAQPPVGDLRFAAPLPPEPWEGVRDAREHGATPQRGDAGITLIPEPSVPGDATLNVDVFTPAPGDRDAALPVMVWIHGGGYVSGSPASPWYDGRAFARDGIVTVCVSYRLGFDGFGWIEGAPSNRGVRDWLLALEWVQEEIRAFGGDPARVTIAGQSAGGGAVLTLLGMPKAQHLFHAAYAMSAAIADVTPSRAQAFAQTLAAAAGLPATRDSLATLPEERLLALQKEAENTASPLRILTEGLALGPMLDGDLLTRPTLESLTLGIGADKPLVLGAVDDEFAMALTSRVLRWIPLRVTLGRAGLPQRSVRPYLAANRDVRPRGHAGALGRYVSDHIFKTGVVRVAEARGAAPTWVYRYAFRSGAYDAAIHCIDVPFWFDCLDAVAVEHLTGPQPPSALAAATHGAARAFIRDGDPGWPTWSARPGTTRVFGGPASAPEVVADGYAGVRPLLAR